MNADYGSKVSTIAITERLQNVKITRLVVGQEQKKDLDNPNFSPEYSFEGRIADMNVWNRGLDKYHIDILYQGTGWQGNAILKWNTLGFPNKRFGEVRFISITSALRRGTYVCNRSRSQILRETLLTVSMVVCTLVEGNAICANEIDRDRLQTLFKMASCLIFFCFNSN